MPLSFKLATALIMLAFPLVEIALLIKAGRAMGLLGLLAVILATGVAGVYVIRMAGLTAVQRLFSEFESGGSPVKSMLDQGLKFTGGVLLLLPGLLGDCIGALLLVPPVRQLLTRSAGSLWKIDPMTERRGGDYFDEHTGVSPAETARHSSGRERTGTITIIEGEYERIDDDDDPPPASRDSKSS